MPKFCVLEHALVSPPAARLRGCLLLLRQRLDFAVLAVRAASAIYTTAFAR
jgi:hypothetical protein